MTKQGHKTQKQQQEWNAQTLQLHRAEKRLVQLHGRKDLAPDAWCQERVGLQRKINRIRSVVRLAPIRWIEVNAEDKALRRHMPREELC